MDVQVYCPNPKCGKYWGTAEPVGPGYEWRPVLPRPDFAAYFDSKKKCWFCAQCGVEIPAHLVGSQPQLWLSDCAQFPFDTPKPALVGHANLGKPIWKRDAAREAAIIRHLGDWFSWW